MAQPLTSKPLTSKPLTSRPSTFKPSTAKGIALLVSDVDGTLVTNDKRLTDDIKRAAARLKEAGIKLSLVSSRPPAGFAMLIGPLKLDAPIGAFNGGAILNPDLSIVEETMVPPRAARMAVDAFEEFGIDAWLFTNDSWYVSTLEGAYVPKERNTIKHEPILVESFEPFFEKVGKLVGSSREFDRVARCEAALGKELGGLAAAKRSQNYYLDVTPDGLDKGSAVKRIAARLGVPIDEVAVIGDMANDLPMFDVAPHRIAMGNAIDDLKRKATYVTDTNENSGFARAVDHYILADA